MPAGIFSLGPFDYQLNKVNEQVPAFTIIRHRGDNFQTTLPILHMDQINNDYDIEGDEEKEKEEDLEEEVERGKSRKDYDVRLMKITEKSCLPSERYSTSSRASNHLELALLQSKQTNPLKKKEYSKSHDNLFGLNETKRKSDSLKSVMSLSTENFTDILNAKLQKLEEQGSDSKKFEKVGKLKKSSSQQHQAKKPFITTVKSGEFLMPPPEVAALIGIGSGALNSNETMTMMSNADRHQNSTSINKFRQFMPSGGRPEVRHNKHNARCQAAAMKGNHHLINSISDYHPTTIKAISNDNHSLIMSLEQAILQSPKRNPTSSSQIQRALPKKLRPIRGTLPIVIKPCNHHHQQPLPFGNIMHDRRVVRGSTFASPVLLENEQSQMKRKLLAKRRFHQQASKSMMLRIKSPPPVPGRRHEPVQTDIYLEELCEKPGESDIGTQTDHFLERATTPPYIPGKIGLDAETQISPGDLFDFDIEVQPILGILVGRTIEEALIEVLEEEELAALREQQRRFLELRAADKAEQLRLEEDERRLRQEKDRRLEQHEKALMTQQETEERVAAAVLLTGYIAELLPAVLEGLKISGFLLDEIREDIKEDFMPWLMKQVKMEIGTVIASRELLTDIVKEILENRAAIYKKLGEEYDSSRDFTTGQYDSEPVPSHEERADTTFLDYQSPDLV